MPDDIIEKIDATLLAEANSKRFDPFGPDWDSTEWDRTLQADSVRSRAGIEEGSEPGDVDLLLLEDVSPDEPQIRRRSPEDRRAYLADQRARHVANGAPPYWLDTFDILAAVACNGSAPTERVADPSPADRFLDAFRAEVIRQGLDRHQIQECAGGGWTVIDETHRFRLDNSSATFTPDRRIRVSVEGEEQREVSVRPWPEPVAPHVDESLKPPGPLRKSGKWWSRLFPGRSTR
jgi:hypothetical protein